MLFQIEARSVEHVKKVAKGLENKIIELQQKLDERVRILGLSSSLAIVIYEQFLW